jgi:integrase
MRRQRQLEQAKMGKHQPLTASRIKDAVTTKSDIWLSDDFGARGCGRLVLRKTPGGVCRFYYREPRAAGKRSLTISLGLYSRVARLGYLTLTQAREAASRIAGPHQRAEAQQPLSTTHQESATTAASVRSESSAAADCHVTLIEICRAYVGMLRAEKRPSAREVHAAFERLIAPCGLAKLPAHEIKSSQITELLRDVIANVSGNTAQRLRSYLHTAYARAIDAKLDPTAPALSVDSAIDSNPVSEVSSLRQFAGKPGDRVLRESELRELWARLSTTDHTPIALRGARLCLLLGGQRAKQLLRVCTRDVDLEARTIRLFDGKGNRTTPRVHMLPLCTLAETDVRWLVNSARELGTENLFPGRGRTTLNASTLSNAVAAIRDAMLADGVCAESFSFTDFRRTVETRLAAAGVTSADRAQLQSHGLSGVQLRHYDRHDYMNEKRNALMLWERILSEL